jgi:hypothetical protein
MPFIQAPIADAKEDELVPEGGYELRIADVQDKDSKKGDAMLQIMIEVTNPPAQIQAPAPIFHYVSLPNEKDDAKTTQYKLKMIRRLLSVFNVPFEDNGFNSDDLNGATGTCLVIQQEIMRDDKPTGEYMHAIRLPKFANEVDDGEAEQAQGTRRQRRR